MKSVRRVILVVESPFSRRDEVRFGIRELRASGLEVAVWEVSPLCLPRSEQQWIEAPDGLLIKRFDSWDDLALEARTLTTSDFVISICGTYVGQLISHARLLAILSSSAAGFGTIWAGVPYWSTQIEDPPARNLTIRTRAAIRSSLSALLARGFQNRTIATTLRWILRRFFRIHPLDAAWVGTSADGIHPLLVSRSTQVTRVHSLDYDQILAVYAAEQEPVVRQIAVLIENLGPFHPDGTTLDLEIDVGPTEFFPIINSALDVIESTTGLSIEIAAHPRSSPGLMEAWYPGRRIRYGETAKAISECELVIIYHESTAVGLAVALGKPIVMCTSSRIGSQAPNLVALLGIGILDADSEGPWTGNLAINEQQYADFMARFVKAPGTQQVPFWTVVARAIREL